MPRSGFFAERRIRIRPKYTKPSEQKTLVWILQRYTRLFNILTGQQEQQKHSQRERERERERERILLNRCADFETQLYNIACLLTLHVIQRSY